MAGHYLLRFHSRAFCCCWQIRPRTRHQSCASAFAPLWADGRSANWRSARSTPESGRGRSSGRASLRPDEVGQLFPGDREWATPLCRDCARQRMAGDGAEQAAGATICGRDSHRRDSIALWCHRAGERAETGSGLPFMCSLPSGRRDDLVHTDEPVKVYAGVRWPGGYTGRRDDDVSAGR